MPGSGRSRSHPAMHDISPPVCLESSSRLSLGGRRDSLTERRGRLVQFVGRDVRITADGGEVGVAEIFRDEARIPGRLPEPRRGRVPERVRCDVLVKPGAFGGPRDDAREDRLLQAQSSKPTEHWVV